MNYPAASCEGLDPEANKKPRPEDMGFYFH